MKAVVAVEAVLSVSESSDWAVLCLRSVVVVTEDGGTAGEGASAAAAAASSSSERIFKVPTACAMAASGELPVGATAAGCWRGGVVTTATAAGAKGAAAVAANSPARPAIYGC